MFVPCILVCRFADWWNTLAVVTRRHLKSVYYRHLGTSADLHRFFIQRHPKPAGIVLVRELRHAEQTYIRIGACVWMHICWAGCETWCWGISDRYQRQIGNTASVVQQTRTVTKPDASLSYIARTALVILKHTFHNISRIGITKVFLSVAGSVEGEWLSGVILQAFVCSYTCNGAARVEWILIKLSFTGSYQMYINIFRQLSSLVCIPAWNTREYRTLPGGNTPVHVGQVRGSAAMFSVIFKLTLSYQSSAYAEPKFWHVFVYQSSVRVSEFPTRFLPGLKFDVKTWFALVYPLHRYPGIVIM
jgi:hypothetical protein